uniref:AP-2 complex subunit sigma n=1 Tax=Albugo laibachii Nc14 TaxID=890382 RepID=F0W4M2_9STRA|nr:conserved unknown protein putative [Albugo laibachii Nc14]|eukprot:CCA16056.1 conserved unknown protein putative [Albugo laibachii Nc14]
MPPLREALPSSVTSLLRSLCSSGLWLLFITSVILVTVSVERRSSSSLLNKIPLDMIRFFLLQNRQGKTRLSKWYVPAPDDQEKFRLENEIHRLVVSRDAKHTNFIEFRSYKLIYRRYAGLFFILGVDLHANELLSLETIHLFVELLDQQFSNVCELDIVFNFNKVYSMLDEYILGGEVQETSKREMLDRIRELEKLE